MADSRSMRRSYSQDAEKCSYKNKFTEQKILRKRQLGWNHSETVTIFPVPTTDFECQDKQTDCSVKSFLPMLESNHTKRDDQFTFPKLTPKSIKVKKPINFTPRNQHNDEYPKMSTLTHSDICPSNDLLSHTSD
ncbi:unnamed protein product [Adineta ricciae]|uniref:Uncharacterized protein n=1 Tax=Adineta ricciae TaxID=249248 RepID=A0A813U2A4_ADIRI|nr:unnamed protein product [Adineta ricciae]CAF0817729.1 unnamed protein product [Adineta ricciae]